MEFLLHVLREDSSHSKNDEVRHFFNLQHSSSFVIFFFSTAASPALFEDGILFYGNWKNSCLQTLFVANYVFLFFVFLFNHNFDCQINLKLLYIFYVFARFARAWKYKMNEKYFK